MSMDASTAAILARGQQFQGEAAARHIAREFYTAVPEAVAWGAGGYVIGKLFENSREICSKNPNSDQCSQANMMAMGSLGFIGGFATLRFVGHRILNDTAPPLQSASFHVSSVPGLAPMQPERGSTGTKLDKHWTL